jgi:hypothetical protein
MTRDADLKRTLDAIPATAGRFKRVAEHLAFVVDAARPRLLELGIVTEDASNPSGWDWVQASPHLSWNFARTSAHASYTAKTTATIRVTAALAAENEPEYEATWRSEAWQNSSPSFHTAQGSATLAAGGLTFGSFERVVLALLRRAAPAFPELLENAGWPGFPDLPSRPTEVDHLVQIRAFHREMVDPWTGPAVGCTETDILALEGRLGWRLPLAYKQYLAFMGADRKGVFTGSDWFLESARVNQIDFELAGMEVAFTPPGDTLIFMSHQGYMFGWMDLPVVSEDPPVYFYSESAKDNRIEHHTRFTGLLLAELEYMSYYTRKLDRRGTVKGA